MNVTADREDDLIYTEQISSTRTEALFLALTAFFAWLSVRRAQAGRRDLLSTVFRCFCAVFLFYSVNYRTLIIRLTPEALKLKFGIFTWVVPLANIEECRHDVLPALMRNGGAGIHFMSIGGRYRASFNFLDHPRIVIALRGHAGPVRDISFSTRRPDEVLRFIGEATKMKLAARSWSSTRRLAADCRPGARPVSGNRQARPAGRSIGGGSCVRTT